MSLSSFQLTHLEARIIGGEVDWKWSAPDLIDNEILESYDISPETYRLVHAKVSLFGPYSCEDCC